MYRFRMNPDKECAANAPQRLGALLPRRRRCLGAQTNLASTAADNLALRKRTLIGLNMNSPVDDRPEEGNG